MPSHAKPYVVRGVVAARPARMEARAGRALTHSPGIIDREQHKIQGPASLTFDTRASECRGREGVPRARSTTFRLSGASAPGRETVARNAGGASGPPR